MTRRELTIDEVAALTRWARAHGRTWKRALWLAWFNGNYGASRDVGVLQSLRNAADFGPRWLDRVKVSVFTTKNEGSKS